MNLRRWNIVKIAILSAFLLTLIAQPAMAQSQNITGAVVDASGGVIPDAAIKIVDRSEEHTSELQSLRHLVCRLLLEKKKKHYAVVERALLLRSPLSDLHVCVPG